MRAVLVILSSLFALLAFGFVMNVLGMLSLDFFGKWGEQIRYDIHKESQTYRDGMQRNLDALISDFNGAEGAARLGVIQAIKHQYSQTDISRLPSYQQDFLRNQVGLY